MPLAQPTTALIHNHQLCSIRPMLALIYGNRLVLTGPQWLLTSREASLTRWSPALGRRSYLNKVGMHWKPNTSHLPSMCTKPFFSLFVRVHTQPASELFGHLTVAVPSVCVLHCWSRTPTICLAIPLFIFSPFPGVIYKSLTIWLLLNLWCLQKLPKSVFFFYSEGKQVSLL